MITMNHHPLHTNDVVRRERDAAWARTWWSGNLVYSLVLGMSVPDVSGAAIANLEVETLKHAKPTFHGDTIYAVTKVLEKKETSDGERGIVTVETKGINQRGEEVCYFRRKVMVWKREFAPQRGLPLRRRRLHRRVVESRWGPGRATSCWSGGRPSAATCRGAAPVTRGRCWCAR